MEKFDVTYKWLSENKDLIKKTLNEREEVLSEPLDIYDDDGTMEWIYLQFPPGTPARKAWRSNYIKTCP